MNNRESRNLALVALVCLACLPPAMLAWLVNLELAVRVWAPQFLLLESILPPGWFAWCATVSSDLSTITTLIPLLMLLYPLVQAGRILRRLPANPAFAHTLEADPYPAHFGFFLVMLGLTGTLYGMFMGLYVSGVPELAREAPTADTIRLALERLLAGTATALLSSLAGLVGAFLAARPIPWLFRKLAGITPAESRRTLTETVESLTADLRELGQASRIFAENLRPQMLAGLFERLERQEAAMRALCGGLQAAGGAIENTTRVQQETNAFLKQIAGLETGLRAGLSRFDGLCADVRESARQQSAQSAKFTELAESVQALRACAEEDTRQLQRVALCLEEAGAQSESERRENARRYNELSATLANLAAVTRQSHDALLADQQSLRQALAAYIGAAALRGTDEKRHA